MEQTSESSSSTEQVTVQIIDVKSSAPATSSISGHEKSISKTVHKSDEKPKNRWWMSLPLLTLLATVFYAQGRMFTEAYLDYFGLNASQFPVSPDDAYWYALLGWSMVAGKGPIALWHIYPRYLLAEWPQLALAVLTPLAGFLGVKFGWWKKLKAITQRLGNNPKIARYFKKPSNDVVKRVAYGGLPTLFLMSVPMIFMVLTFCVALLIYLVVLPFWALGRKDAMSDCSTAAVNHPIVHYIGEPTADAPARLLQCGPNFCAVIRDGEATAIPRTSIQSVSGVPIGRKISTAPVQKSQQLCAIPAQKKNP